MAADPPEEINHRHMQIADEMLANPGAKMGEIADRLGYTRGWLSTIVNSNTFQAYFQRRRLEFNEQLATQAQKRSLELGIKAMDEAERKLDEEELDPVEVFDRALKHSGLRPSGAGSSGSEGGGDLHLHFTATKEELAEAREAMKAPVYENEGGSGDSDEGSQSSPKQIEHQTSGEG